MFFEGSWKAELFVCTVDGRVWVIVREKGWKRGRLLYMADQRIRVWSGRYGCGLRTRHIAAGGQSVIRQVKALEPYWPAGRALFTIED